jgi:hypothetical protein
MLGDQAPPTEALGWKSYQGEEMWKEEWVSFAEVAFDAGAFSGSSLERLRDVPQVADHNDTAELSLDHPRINSPRPAGPRRCS